MQKIEHEHGQFVHTLKGAHIREHVLKWSTTAFESSCIWICIGSSYVLFTLIVGRRCWSIY